MDWNRVCPACMKEYIGEGSLPVECPSCGYKYYAQNGIDMLPPRTILNGKYILGRSLRQSDMENVYLAYDLNLEVKIHIRELFPKNIVRRKADGRTVEEIGALTQQSFDKIQAEYVEQTKKLAKGNTFGGEEVHLREIFRENGTVYKVLVEEQLNGFSQDGTEDDKVLNPMELFQDTKKNKTQVVIGVITALLAIWLLGSVLGGNNERQPNDEESTSVTTEDKENTEEVRESDTEAVTETKAFEPKTMAIEVITNIQNESTYYKDTAEHLGMYMDINQDGYDDLLVMYKYKDDTGIYVKYGLWTFIETGAQLVFSGEVNKEVGGNSGSVYVASGPDAWYIAVEKNEPQADVFHKTIVFTPIPPADNPSHYGNYVIYGKADGIYGDEENGTYIIGSGEERTVSYEEYQALYSGYNFVKEFNLYKDCGNGDIMPLDMLLNGLKVEVDMN